MYLLLETPHRGEGAQQLKEGGRDGMWEGGGLSRAGLRSRVPATLTAHTDGRAVRPAVSLLLGGHTSEAPGLRPKGPLRTSETPTETQPGPAGPRPSRGR